MSHMALRQRVSHCNRPFRTRVIRIWISELAMIIRRRKIRSESFSNVAKTNDKKWTRWLNGVIRRFGRETIWRPNGRRSQEALVRGALLKGRLKPVESSVSIQQRLIETINRLHRSGHTEWYHSKSLSLPLTRSVVAAKTMWMFAERVPQLSEIMNKNEISLPDKSG